MIKIRMSNIGFVVIVMANAIYSLIVSSHEASAKIAEPCAEISMDDSQTYMAAAREEFGGVEFAEPPNVEPTSVQSKYDLTVRYTNHTSVGCNVRLRTYNGKLVGDTIRAKPGDTLHIRLMNAIASGRRDDHPQEPPPGDHKHFSFDVTNLHTHGLHVDPVGTPGYASDNVLIEIGPGQAQEYKIHIPQNHPTGTFWYHAHLHGSTAIQVSSGMVGALIIEGGSELNGDLSSVPAIGQAKERLFVLEQIKYDSKGELENFETVVSGNFRPTLINGQFVPTIRMRPGEVQRWRFIHAGVQENIHLALNGLPLYEIAADGLTLGRMVKWPTADEITEDREGLILGPGYRSDVLVKAGPLPTGKTQLVTYLRDTRLSAQKSIRVSSQVFVRSQDLAPLGKELFEDMPEKPDQILATVIIEGDPMDMHLPSQKDLHALIPKELESPTEAELSLPPTQTVDFRVSSRRFCEPATGKCDLTKSCDLKKDENCWKQIFVVGDGTGFYAFTNGRARVLKLDTIERWSISGKGFLHPYHIHVNPFWFMRDEPDEEGGISQKPIWKDTVLAPIQGPPLNIWSRYKTFIGDFVMHCHILDHEDRGMMELVRIVP